MQLKCILINNILLQALCMWSNNDDNNEGDDDDDDDRGDCDDEANV